MKQKGFTLIELAIVLAVVGLVIGGLLIPLSMQVEQQKIRETQKAMEEIKEALIGFAASKTTTPSNRPYLPCPDVTSSFSHPTLKPNDGEEDRCLDTNGDCASLAKGRCVGLEGNVPWATLGVSEVDGWGSRLRYRVQGEFAYSGDGVVTTDGFQLMTSPSTDTNPLGRAVRVCGNSTCTGSSLATSVPAVILSHGKNGWGAMNSSGTIYAAPSNPDELENISSANENGVTATPTSVTFVSRTITPSATPCSDSAPGPAMPLCEFDDLVTWLSPNILFSRMVAAGRMP